MFAKALIVGALAALAAAQGTSSTLFFTRVPSPITAGQQQALTYATADSSAPVTILLRKGNPNDLQTVATLTTSATNGQYIWNVDKSLENGSDYALEIKQGSDINYFGPFQIQGGSSGASASASSSSASAYTSMSMTLSGSSSAIATITASRNSSAITTATISAGTGYSMSRNATMSSATLSGSSTSSGSATRPTASNNAGFQGSQTSASAPANTGAASSLVATGSSALALVFGAVAAVFFC